MKRLLILFAITIAAFASTDAQNQSLFKGLFYNTETKMQLHLDLDSETVKVPGLPFLGGTNGYMSGGIIYGTWFITDFKKDKNSATIRLTNDFGADTQVLNITHIKADTFNIELQQPVVIKKVVKNKLVKIGSKYTFIKR